MAVLVTLSFLLGLAQKSACQQIQWDIGKHGVPASVLHDGTCYTDIPVLYRSTFAHGQLPYAQPRLTRADGSAEYLEYPVLTGVVMYAAAAVTRAFGDDDDAAEAVRYYLINVGLLWLLALLTGWTIIALSPAGRVWDALFFAVAPSLAYNGTSNWDLLPVACTGVALVAWQRHRLTWTGVLLGLGAAAKLYPILVLGPLLVLGLRAGRFREVLRTAAVALLTAALVYLPFVLFAPGWSYFFTMNSGRGPDFGSVWLLLANRGVHVPNLNAVTLALFLALCLAIAVLGLRAQTRPRLIQLVLLVMLAFLLTNKVYSVQYVLWLVPLLVLAHPVARHVLPWLGIELLYWQSVWNVMSTGAGDTAQRYYEAATALHLLGLVWIAALVVRDVLRPQRDKVRLALAADPAAADPDAVLTAG
mgnify:FL=1